MTGYEKSRFVNLTKNESQQLMCGICLAILRNPKYTKCCEQAYCLDCIEEWLSNSETCPNDRKQLNMDELCNVPKFVKNMLLDMELSCQFIELGCTEVLKLEFIEHHEANCRFNTQAICENCLSENGERSKHQCIKNLKIKYLNGEERIKELTKELGILKSKYSSIKDVLSNELLRQEKDLAECKQNEKVLLKHIESLDNESKQMHQTILESEKITQMNQDRIETLKEKLESAQKGFISFHTNTMLSYETLQESFDFQLEIIKKSFDKVINDNKMFVQNSAEKTNNEILALGTDDGQKVLKNELINILNEKKYLLKHTSSKSDISKKIKIAMGNYIIIKKKNLFVKIPKDICL